jgi:hypothetical protein
VIFSLLHNSSKLAHVAKISILGHWLDGFRQHVDSGFVQEETATTDYIASRKNLCP